MACEWDVDRACYSVTLPTLGDTPTADEQAAYDAALATQNAAEDTAVHILWSLSGRQFGVCDATARPCPTSWVASVVNYGLTEDLYGWGRMPVFYGGTWVGLPCGCAGRCAVSGPRVVHLPGPVQSVTMVTVAGAVLDSDAYQVEGDALHRRDGHAWPGQDLGRPLGEPGTWSVDYRRGTPVPPGVDRFVGALANEFINAACGNKDACRVPVKTRQMSGRGGSFEFDASFFLDKGRTGLDEVDRWLVAANPNRLAEPSAVL